MRPTFAAFPHCVFSMHVSFSFNISPSHKLYDTLSQLFPTLSFQCLLSSPLSPLCVFNVSSPSHKLCELPHFQSKPLISSFLLRCNSAALARHRLQMDVKSFPAFKSRRMPENNASTDRKRRFFQKCVLATRSDWQKAHRLLYFQSFHTLFLKR